MPYYTTTTCTSTAAAPTLAPALGVIPPFPAGSTAVTDTSTYLYTLRYNSTSCSTLTEAKLIQLNTCALSDVDVDDYTDVINIVEYGRMYQKIIAAYDGTTPTTLYYMTVYYSDSACSTMIPSVISGSKGVYSYTTQSNMGKCSSGVKTGTTSNVAALLPASGIYQK